METSNALVASYYWKQSNNVHVENQRAAFILKSHYLINCRKLEMQRNVRLPAKSFKSSVRCPQCCINYTDGFAHYAIKKRKCSKFAKRLLKKHENNQPMTTYQEIYFNKLKKANVQSENCNELVVSCNVCKNVTKQIMEKPLVKKELNVLTPSKSKRKRKDRFSGLNKEVVLSVTPNKRVKNIPFSTNTPKKVDSLPEKKHNNKNKFNINKVTTSNKNQKLKVTQGKNKQLKQNLLNSLHRSSGSAPSSSLKKFLQDII